MARDRRPGGGLPHRRILLVPQASQPDLTPAPALDDQILPLLHTHFISFYTFAVRTALDITWYL